MTISQRHTHFFSAPVRRCGLKRLIAETAIPRLLDYGKFYRQFENDVELSAMFLNIGVLACEVLYAKTDEVAHKGHSLRGYRPESSKRVALFSSLDSAFLEQALR